LREFGTNGLKLKKKSTLKEIVIKLILMPTTAIIADILP
jgi:hypothetical protein